MDLERLPTRGAEGEPSSRKEKGSGEEAEARVRVRAAGVALMIWVP